MLKTWIDLVESSKGIREARQAIGRTLTDVDGQQYFERVRDLVGEDRDRAQHLASHWRLLLADEETRAWAYRTKGVLDRLAGRWMPSVRAFQKAARHSRDPVQKHVFQIGSIDSLGRAGHVQEAVRLADKICRGLISSGHLNDAGLAHLNAANALLWHDEYVRARKHYKKALEMLDPALSEAMSVAAKLGLSTAELYGGRPRKAHDLAAEAEEDFRRLHLTEFAVLARKNRGQAALLLGRLDEALDTFLDLRPLIASGSLEAARLEEFLGDAYGRLNMWPEASDAYEAALGSLGIKSSPLNQANSLMGLGSALTELGRTKEAATILGRSASRFRSFGNKAWEAAAHIQLGVIARQQGNLARSDRILNTCVETLTDLRSLHLLAVAQMELAETEGASGRNPLGRIAEADRLVRHLQFKQAEWRVHWLRARWSGPESQRRHYRRMAVAIWQARALTSSTVSRASYLTDKATALTEYVTFLLSRPTRSRVEEAVAVVRDSRSVALLEEILAATEPAVGKSRALLAQLREELHEAIGGEGPLGTTRRTGSTTPNLATIQRQWIELNRNVRASVNTSVNTGDWPDILLVEARDQQFAIKGRKVHVLNWNRPELEEKLKWLRFELMAPMVDATTNPHVVNSRLDEFSHALWQPISEKTNEVVTICPDGTLWQVPWQVLAASESDSEVVLSVGAWSGRAQGRLPAKPKTMIWHHAAPGLPDIERETSRFLERFPDSVSCSSIIDVRRCLEEGDVDVLHIAAHARFHSTNPMFSSLVFDGGRVTGAEIANSKLRAKHVVLSACETGTVSLQNRTEPEGLVRAFLSRGASCVLASTWALDDRSAYQYMETYYQALMSGVAFAGSARAARSQVRYSNPHPYYWGSFALFGGYTS